MSGTALFNVSLTVNGAAQTVEVEGRRTLADLLRHDLGLTGTHLGCEHGVCGSCTVLVDGATARSCLMLAAQADGASVETVESLAEDGRLGLIQQAMWEQHAFQCAFCAPGFLMTIRGLLETNPEAGVDEIKEELSGNLCRCTGYRSIVDGVMAAVGKIAARNGEAADA